MLFETVHKWVFDRYQDYKRLIERYHPNNKQTNSFTFCIMVDLRTPNSFFTIYIYQKKKHCFLIKTLHLPSVWKIRFGLTRKCPIKLCLACFSLQDSGENGSKSCAKNPLEDWGERMSLCGQFFSASSLFFSRLHWPRLKLCFRMLWGSQKIWVGACGHGIFMYSLFKFNFAYAFNAIPQ